MAALNNGINEEKEIIGVSLRPSETWRHKKRGLWKEITQNPSLIWKWKSRDAVCDPLTVPLETEALHRRTEDDDTSWQISESVLLCLSVELRDTEYQDIRRSVRVCRSHGAQKLLEAWTQLKGCQRIKQAQVLCKTVALKKSFFAVTSGTGSVSTCQQKQLYY